jgi:hypothetical protein
MQFKTAASIEQIVWQMKLADYSRSLNRSRINSLYNGAPPYTDQEATENNIAINVNSLEPTKLAHDARSQFNNAFLKPGQYFTARTDMGPVHKRQKYGAIVSREVNRIMKRSPMYFETMRSKFAQLVLHGIAPTAWETRENWCPDAVGIEDVMIPSNTLITMKNLPFFAIFRSYTAEELYRLTHGPRVDKAWKMPVVEAALKWAGQEQSRLSGTTWPQVWSPEKWEESIKENSGLFASDAVPTIDTWDFYFWNDSKKVSGWNRRIVLDAYGQPGVGGVVPDKPNNKITGGNGSFLYDPGDRKYGCKMSEIINFQFADLSAVAPFRYHSVRSLGFLLYAVGHLQNRLRCKFNEAVFESLMMYMRVKSMDDAERALKINLISRGIIDETVQFLPAAERWQVNAELAALGMNQNQQIINQNAGSYVQSQGKTNPDVEKTAFQVRAELNATTALISAALLQAYQYQTFEYHEIFRRFCVKNSRDVDVRTFRLNCLKAGVPEKMLVSEAWELEPERVMGSGNKTMEMAIAQQLMEWRPLYDPQSQQEILRISTLATTDDPGLTKLLVPDTKDKLTDSKQNAMMAMGTLMLGLPVKFGQSDNRIEVTEVLLAELAMIVGRIQKTTGMATAEQLVGFQTIVQTIEEQIQIISQDDTQAERARKYSEALSKLMNLIKAFAQRLQQQMKAAAANGANGQDPEAAAKVQATMMQAKVKADNASTSHAQKTAQRQVQWEADEKRKQQQHDFDLAAQAKTVEADIAATDAETAAEIRRQRVKAENEPKEKATAE